MQAKTKERKKTNWSKKYNVQPETAAKTVVKPKPQTAVVHLAECIVGTLSEIAHCHRRFPQ